MISVLRVRSWTRAAGSAGIAAALCLLPATALAAPVKPSTYGLYGAQDPTYDGAFRQSLAILALGAAGEPVPRAAIDWLAHQQCEDGGWTAFRKDLSKPCDTGAEDSNSTAMAVQALASVGGESSAVGRGADWLVGQQNPDGGIGARPGSDSDANSTALFAQALRATGKDPATTTSTGGESPQDALLGLRIDCDPGLTAGGGFAFTSGKEQPSANTLATVAAVFALSGQVLPVTNAGNTKPKEPTCPGERNPDAAAATATATGAYYIAEVLRENSERVPALQGDKADWGTTANAVIALSAVGAKADARKAMAALAKHASGYVAVDGEDLPGALAKVVLASVATGTDPHQVAGDAVQRLAATGVGAGSSASAAPTVTPSATPLAGGTGSDGAGGGGSTWIAFAVIGIVVAIGIGVLLGRGGSDQQAGPSTS